jgi:deferrochelatase/peroxidase EfeB
MSSQLTYKKAQSIKLEEMQQLQEGIYYKRNPAIGNSLSVILLRSKGDADAIDIGNTIRDLWQNLRNLKKGIVKDLDVDFSHRLSGELSILVGYGPSVFKIKSVRKKKPEAFDDKWLFNKPSPLGGGALVNGSDLTYAPDVNENDALGDHVLLQFIGKSEFFSNRAIVEVWRELERKNKSTGKSCLEVSAVYTGFFRPDRRNWLGFHDGVSNMNSQERVYAIAIKPNQLNANDKWLTNGTYISFIRIYTDLNKWDDLERETQEIIIGRDKSTGCPLIGVDKNGKPVKDRRCPILGTSEVVDPGNEYFRNHPDYGRKFDSKSRISDEVLKDSHIASSRPIDTIPVWDKRSFRIFRQGFEFLDTQSRNGAFSVGLNFISFQNTPERLFKTLTYFQKLQTKDSQHQKQLHLSDFTSVRAGGIFLAPPTNDYESFPGETIFF